jgi:hypothetical protein
VSPSDILDSDSGAVAYVIRQQIKRFQEGKSGSSVSSRPFVKTFASCLVIFLFWRGSKASLSPSPIKFTHSATATMNTPGYQNNQGLVVKAF